MGFKRDVFSKEENEAFERMGKQMGDGMSAMAPGLANAAGSMMTEMLKRFWWIPVLGLTILGLFIWGIVAIVT